MFRILLVAGFVAAFIYCLARLGKPSTLDKVTGAARAVKDDVVSAASAAEEDLDAAALNAEDAAVEAADEITGLVKRAETRGGAAAKSLAKGISGAVADITE